MKRQTRIERIWSVFGTKPVKTRTHREWGSESEGWGKSIWWHSIKLKCIWWTLTNRINMKTVLIGSLRGIQSRIAQFSHISLYLSLFHLSISVTSSPTPTSIIAKMFRIYVLRTKGTSACLIKIITYTHRARLSEISVCMSLGFNCNFFPFCKMQTKLKTEKLQLDWNVARKAWGFAIWPHYIDRF